LNCALIVFNCFYVFICQAGLVARLDQVVNSLVVFPGFFKMVSQKPQVFILALCKKCLQGFAYPVMKIAPLF